MLNGLLTLMGADSFLDTNKLNIHAWMPPDDKMHGHEFFELVYVRSGTALQQLGAEAFPVHAGDYFMMDLNCYHCYRQTNQLSIINCLFSPECINRALVNCQSLTTLMSSEISVPASQLTNPAGHIYHDDDGQIGQLMEQMLREYNAKALGYLEMIRCCLIEVLILFLRHPAVNAVRQYHPAVVQLAQYLDEQCDQELSMGELSARLGYTPQYLCSLFHQETGMTPGTYLQKVKIGKSCRLLTDGGMNVSQVAQAVGYQDTKYFTQVFKRYVGVSPRDFRGRRKVRLPLQVADKLEAEG